MIERRIQSGDRVMEKSTERYGIVKRCLWLVDLKTDAPARAACIVRFDDGREVQRTEDQLTYVRRPQGETMQQWSEVERGRLWQTSVGNILTVYVAKTSAGDFEARVVGMNGIIEIAADINFGRIAQDVGLAMAHRILRDEALRLEGKTPADSDTAAELAALRARVAELEQRIAAALAVDAPADVEALAMRAALKGGDQSNP